MSITQPIVAIITVTYNSASFINNYLNAITPFIADSTHHLVIVDNDSSDNTCALIKQHIATHQLDQQITLIEQNTNNGFGKGCNIGATAAKQCQPAFLWFLNPDTQVFNDTGDELLHFFDQNQHADFAGSVLVNKDNQVRAGAFRFPGLINTFLSETKLGLLDRVFSRYTTAAPIQTSPYSADWLTGASFMVRAQHFYTLKGFDPYYFLYFEEVDLFYRAKAIGLSTWACPSSRVFHISGASTGINNHQKATKRRPNYWFESRRYFYLNNFSRLYFIAIDILLISSHLLWRARAFLQKKDDDTPPHFIRDIIRYSYIGSLFFKKK